MGKGGAGRACVDTPGKAGLRAMLDGRNQDEGEGSGLGEKRTEAWKGLCRGSGQNMGNEGP